MKRSRNAFRYATLLAATLFACLFAAIWIRSYFVVDLIRIRSNVFPLGSASVWFNIGRLEVAFGANFPGDFVHERISSAKTNTTAQEETRGLLGLRIPIAKPRHPYRWITIPYWLGLVATVLTATQHVRSICRERRRKDSGRCFHCGYDLRATPDRCPECGRVVVFD